MFYKDQIGNVPIHVIGDPRLCTFIQQSATQLIAPKCAKRPAFRFPGPMPITVEREHVNRIRGGDVKFTPKADGTRVLLTFTQYFIDGEKRRICALLHRDATCHLVQMSVHPSTYDNGGSIFDAELITLTDGRTTRLEIFDCYAYAGITVTGSTLTRRLKLVAQLIQGADQSQPNALQMNQKPYFSLQQSALDIAQSFVTNRHQLDYKTDGVVLVFDAALNAKEQFKVKMRHTVDLIIVKDDEDNNFYLASYDDADDSYVTKQSLKVLPQGAAVNTVVECDMLVADDTTVFTPICVRYDKHAPNNERVIERTIKTVNDNITLGMLV